MSTTYKLLLLPGDGIGVETMAEVERLLAFFNQKSNKASFETDDDLVGGVSIDKYGVPLTNEALTKAQMADAVIFGSVGRAEVGRRALRNPPRGRPAAPAQGDGPVRQPPARDLLSGAGRGFVATPRVRRRPRHSHPARTDGRNLFRRAEGDRDARERREARRRHHALHHGRDRAHRQGRLRSGAHALEQGALGRKAQRHEDRRALERGRHPDACRIRRRR